MTFRLLATSLAGYRAGLRTKCAFTKSLAELHHSSCSGVLLTQPGRLLQTWSRSAAKPPMCETFRTRTTTVAYFARSYPKPHPLFQLQHRFFSSNHTFHPPSEPLPTLSPPSVGRWLIISSLLVYAVIVVGGMTRLTESGLSITEWRPITGVLPPISQEEWEEEFTKYKATPEFKL